MQSKRCSTSHRVDVVATFGRIVVGRDCWGRSRKSEGSQPASAAPRLRRGILRLLRLAWFTEPKLAEGERRMVDQTGIEPVTS